MPIRSRTKSFKWPDWILENPLVAAMLLDKEGRATARTQLRYVGPDLIRYMRRLLYASSFLGPGDFVRTRKGFEGPPDEFQFPELPPYRGGFAGFVNLFREEAMPGLLLSRGEHLEHAEKIVKLRRRFRYAPE